VKYFLKHPFWSYFAAGWCLGIVIELWESTCYDAYKAATDAQRLYVMLLITTLFAWGLYQAVKGVLKQIKKEAADGQAKAHD
jgi:bacteriorhodopsin